MAHAHSFPVLLGRGISCCCCTQSVGLSVHLVTCPRVCRKLPVSSHQTCRQAMQCDYQDGRCDCTVSARGCACVILLLLLQQLAQEKSMILQRLRGLPLVLNLPSFSRSIPQTATSAVNRKLYFARRIRAWLNEVLPRSTYTS
jgi:hypothetical protein